jgi:hypothetical protein
MRVESKRGVYGTLAIIYNVKISISFHLRLFFPDCRRAERQGVEL